MPSNIVVVESPAKAKAIQSYLGKQYKVVASMGHVRSLPSRPGSVMPEKDFMAVYEDNSKKQIQILLNAAKDSKNIYLATDPDREGEAISFHIAEVFRENGIIKQGEVSVYRVVFTAITKTTVLEAIKNPRNINLDLVYAQQARQNLDYLFGFTLSPLLWHKLPSTKSAGRVQSVSLRLICEQEDEISAFKSEEFWNIKALFGCDDKEFFATLTHLEEKKVDKFYCRTQNESEVIVKELQKRKFLISKVISKHVKRHPKPPLITSTLQQEASTKLQYDTKKTMSIAQKLYEGIKIGDEIIGLITYMRTDGLYIEANALKQIAEYIRKQFGEKYLPEKQRIYKSKIRNAQEAHEAIRPINMDLDLKTVKQYLSTEQFKVYSLIWNRTLAAQMSDAIIAQRTLFISTTDNYAAFSATTSKVVFKGFYAVDSHEGQENELPELNEQDLLTLNMIKPEQSFTQPPPRYTEAALIKKMESLGIGRPSTYSSMISVIQDRGYAKMENRSFVPAKVGQILTLFLKTFFKKYVEYDFTANLEEELDAIALGEVNCVEILNQFWTPFIAQVNEIHKIDRLQVLELLEDQLKQYVLPKNTEGEIQEVCPKCKSKLKVSMGKFGVFVRCSEHPECDYTVKSNNLNDPEPKMLCIHPKYNQEIYIKHGPYGQYLQMGTKKVPIPKNKEFANCTIEKAVQMLELPYSLGCSPGTTDEIIIGIGYYGPYLKYQGKYTSIRPIERLSNLTLIQAVELIEANVNKKSATKKSKKNSN